MPAAALRAPAQHIRPAQAGHSGHSGRSVRSALACMLRGFISPLRFLGSFMLFMVAVGRESAKKNNFLEENLGPRS